MKPVITAEEARKITGGREPFGILEYEQAVVLLRQCITIEDAKRFATLADARAAWAKIKHDNTVLRLAKALKLHAARHMGTLAEVESPTGRTRGSTGRSGLKGNLPGARSVLLQTGMSDDEARSSTKLARMSEAQFNAVINAPRIPSLSRISRATNQFQVLSASLTGLAVTIRNYSPLVVARECGLDLKPRVLEISEWCDELLQRLDAKRGSEVPHPKYPPVIYVRMFSNGGMESYPTPEDAAEPGKQTMVGVYALTDVGYLNAPVKFVATPTSWESDESV